jgi:hypothetical protein
LCELYPFGSKVPEHRDEGPDVKRDVECQSGVRPAENPWGEDEMSGAADGQKLAESLDDPKDQRLKHGHVERAKGDDRDGDASLRSG